LGRLGVTPCCAYESLPINTEKKMTEKLIAVRSNATVDFVHKGVTFKIGILPRHIYGKFMSVSMKINKDKLKDGELFDAQYEVVKYGVKGHEEFCYADGDAVPFKEEVVHGKGGRVTCVSEETMSIYYASKVIDALSMHIATGAGDSGDQGNETVEEGMVEEA